jgi:hypothetical protein
MLRRQKGELFHNKSRLFAVFIVFYIALVVEVSISNIADIQPTVSDFRISPLGIGLFVLISIIFLVCQFIIMKHSFIPKEIGISPFRRISFFKIIQFVQYFLGVILVIVVLQILLTSMYDRLELVVAVILSYGLATVLMGLLAYRLFEWFTVNKNMVILLFGIAASFTAINAAVSLYLFDEILIASQPSVIVPSTISEWKLPHEQGDYMVIVNQLQFISMWGYFIMTYVGTIFLLIHHIKKIGMVKFWVLVITPLLFFVYNYPVLFKYVLPDAPNLLPHPPETIPNFILSTISIALLGIVIGIGFFSVSYSIKGKAAIRSSLIITAFGFIFFFNAADASVLHVPYPPYGLANVSFVGFSAFLIYAGLYKSAVSISKDVQLRNLIRKSVQHQFKFLSGLGIAQLRQEMEKSIDVIIKESEFARPNIEHTSLSEEEVKQYANEVLEELAKFKTSQ